MKLKEYIEKLEELAKKNPEALEFDVITSIDAEGNGYNLVHYSPSLGEYSDCEFRQMRVPNAVCVN